MMNTPLFSIITINYNDAVGLERTIKSVLAQNFTPYEHIIIDGASSDGSVEVIKKYEKLYTKGVLTWLSESDGGIYHAMNKGIKLAKGTWLNMMNAGDWFDANALDLIDSYITSSPTTEVFISAIRCHSNSKENYLEVLSEELQYPTKLRSNYINHQGMFYKKTLHDQYGYYREDLQYASDYAFTLELFYKNKTSFYPVSTCVVNYVIGGSGSSYESWLEAEQLRVDYAIIEDPAIQQALLKRYNSKISTKTKKLIKWISPYAAWAIKQRLEQFIANKKGKSSADKL